MPLPVGDGARARGRPEDAAVRERNGVQPHERERVDADELPAALLSLARQAAGECDDGGECNVCCWCESQDAGGYRAREGRREERRGEGGGSGYLHEMERRLWEDVPWVACNKGLDNCSGTIRKADWLQDRGAQCSGRIVEHLARNPNTLAVELDLCNINAQMDGLCRAMLDKVRFFLLFECVY